MIVSWNWLKDYVDLPGSTEEFTRRLTLAGLNLESVTPTGDDVAIDLEVTSNRADCLGHLGVAREAAVLWQTPLRTPQPAPATRGAPTADLATVELTCPEICPRYVARVIRNVRIGPSPEWLARRLRTLGLSVINNVVDATNYVMMECGQPLHAFDLGRLDQRRIVVRTARAGESLAAIDHREYVLPEGACVIADARRPVALAGVMGGADTEVTAETVDLLIEAARFEPLAVRRLARRLNLHSPSSYRFERGVDPAGVDWASRRCCELILQLAGGELAPGSIDVGAAAGARPPIVLRLGQIARLLGIAIPPETVARILGDLGAEVAASGAAERLVTPPSWRGDLTREVDLIEEVARIHGYDQIPEDVGVKMAASAQSRDDRVVAVVHRVLLAAGFFEALTLSAVEAEWIDVFRPWTDQPPLATSTPVLRRANCLRQSLAPSLLAVRRHNEKLANPRIEVFEIAKVYLPAAEQPLPVEKRLLTLCSGGDLLALKGVCEALVEGVHHDLRLSTESWEHPLFAAGSGCRLLLGDRLLGFLGELGTAGRALFDLRGPATVAELDLELFVEAAELVCRARPLSPYPPVHRDVNVVVDERIAWGDVARVAAEAGGPLVEQIAYQDAYRDPDRLGKGKKSLLFSLQLRSHQGTLTSEQADAVRDRIVAALQREVGGQLRA